MKSPGQSKARRARPAGSAVAPAVRVRITKGTGRIHSAAEEVRRRRHDEAAGALAAIGAARLRGRLGKPEIRQRAELVEIEARGRFRVAMGREVDPLEVAGAEARAIRRHLPDLAPPAPLPALRGPEFEAVAELAGVPTSALRVPGPFHDAGVDRAIFREAVLELGRLAARTDPTVEVLQARIALAALGAVGIAATLAAGSGAA